MAYLVRGTNDIGGTPKQVEKALNQLESEGWRLISTMANNQGFTKQGWFVFHREGPATK